MASHLSVLLLLLPAVMSTAVPSNTPQYLLDPSWLDRFTITPIRIPGYPGGYPFPATFPFPVTYPLPIGFPYAPQVYESILPTLIAQYNSALAATANQVAAAAAAAAVAAPAIAYRPPEPVVAVPVTGAASTASASASATASGHSA